MNSVLLDDAKENVHLLIGCFSLEVIAQLSTTAILNFLDNCIRPEEQELGVR